MVEFAYLYLSVRSVRRDKVVLFWKLNILLSMAAYGGTSPPGKPKGRPPPLEKIFFLSNHKSPKFEIIQTPGGDSKFIKNPLQLEIFISRHWFYLNTGTIDLLCIILLIRTVGAWDFLSQKKILTTTPWLPWNCLKIITEENTDFLFIISCCLNALDPKYNTFFIKYTKNKLFLKKNLFD